MSDLTADQQIVSPEQGSSAGLTQKAYLNAVVAVLEYGVQMVIGLLVNPLLVAGLGSMLFGILQILRRLTDYLSAADGRPTQALKWAIANQQYSDDHAAKRLSISHALGVWLLFMPVLLSVGMLVVWFSPAVTKASAELASQVRIASALLILDLLLYGIVNLPESVLQGMNLGYKRMGMRVGVAIVRGVLTGGAAYFGLGLVGIAAASLVTSCIGGVLFWGTIRKYVPWYGLVRPKMDGVLHFLAFSGWFFAWTLVSRVLLYSDVVILGVVTTAEHVSIYTLTGYAAALVTSFIGIAVSAIIPGLGGVIGDKQHDKATLIRSEMLIANWLLAMSIGVCILLWNRSFVDLWVGASYYAGPLASLLIVVTTVQLVFIRTDASIIDLTLDLRRKVAMGSLSVLLSVGLAAVFTKLWGIVGLCLGLIAGRSILTIAYPLLIGSALEMSPRVRLLGLVRPGGVMIGAFGLSSYLGQYLHTEGWIEFFVYAGLSFALATGAGFLCGLTKEQREAMVQRFKQVRLLKRV
jgi:O-antigen/teichoic acid export membrane protein